MLSQRVSDHFSKRAPRKSFLCLMLTSSGIAIIPESLIAVLTITFVTGMTQMRKRKVLTRNLSALEALGGITSKS